jgi:signal peptidase I
MSAFFKKFLGKKNQPKGFLQNLGEIIFAILVALLIRSLFFQPFKIPSESLYPTMLIGDYLAVYTGKYGYSKHSFPYSLPLVKDRVLYKAPERGEIVVFRFPEGADLPRSERLFNDIKGFFVFSDRIPLDSYWIKRVVGLPGDRVQFKKGILYINGVPAPQRLDGEFGEKMPSGRTRYTTQYIETLPNGVEHTLIRESQEGILPSDNTREYRVPKDHFFMVGDNRNHSNDSRYDYLGPVHKDYLIGQAKVVLFSIDSGILDLWKIWEWPEIVRLKRFFSRIH